jgi:8-oxo-dGTP diphosphatase
MNEMPVVIKGIIENEGKFLIIKRSDEEEVGAGTWEFVGGKIEFGEDLETALHREIQEEVGLEADIEKFLYAATFIPKPKTQVIIITYLCSSSSLDVVLSEEHSAYKWAEKEEMKRMLPVGILKDLEKNHIFSVL